MSRFMAGVALAAVLAIGASSAAEASGYTYDFSSFTPGALEASGTVTIAPNGSTLEVISLTGTVSGTDLAAPQTISGVFANSLFPNVNTSSDGAFYYDNIFNTMEPRFDIDGLLFSTLQNPNGFWNLWGNGPGNYSLYESVNGLNYPVAENGTLSLTATPLPQSWWLLLTGLIGFGLFAHRQTRGRSAAQALAYVTCIGKER